jgi:CO/xanthine dehydrogenase FAD-binding subunit
MTGWTRPHDLGDALGRLAADPALVPFAGGTDLMVLVNLGTLRGGRFLDLWRLDELRGIAVSAAEVAIGALATYAEIAAHPAIRARHPMLAQAAAASGAWAVQNRGTLAGNLGNASPAADSPPALLAYGARVELCSTRGARWVACQDFHQGYRRTARASDELITRIVLPRPAAGLAHFYRKVGTRRAQAISKVCLAGVAARRDGRLAGVAIALGAVGPTPLLCPGTGAYLEGRVPADVDRREVRRRLQSEIAPIDDDRSTAWYRRQVAGNLLEQFLDELEGSPSPGGSPPAA